MAKIRHRTGDEGGLLFNTAPRAYAPTADCSRLKTEQSVRLIRVESGWPVRDIGLKSWGYIMVWRPANKGARGPRQFVGDDSRTNGERTLNYADFTRQ